MTAFAVPSPQTVTTVRLTRIGLAVVDTFPIHKYMIALRNSNGTDEIIVINDVKYNFSSAEFLVNPPPAPLP